LIELQPQSLTVLSEELGSQNFKTFSSNRALAFTQPQIQLCW